MQIIKSHTEYFGPMGHRCDWIYEATCLVFKKGPAVNNYWPGFISLGPIELKPSIETIFDLASVFKPLRHTNEAV